MPATSAYSAAVASAIDAQLKSFVARSRPAAPYAAAAPGSLVTSVSTRARSATNRSGSSGVPVPSCTCSIGTSRPVTPSTTTSGMPPVAVPTTAAPHAMASRLTIPSGSYTEGQTNVVAALRIVHSSWRDSIRSIQTTPSRVSWRVRTRPSTSAMICGVSGAPAHRMTCTSAGSLSAARRK